MRSVLSTMSTRERWCAALALKPLDRLPFWPKLFGGYVRNQAPHWRDRNLDGYIGSDPHINVPGGLREIRKDTGYEQREDSGERIDVYRTPGRDLIRRWIWDSQAHCYHPVQFPVQTREDILAMTRWYQDVRVELNPEEMAAVRDRCDRIGESGSTWTVNGESPLMEWIEYIAGVENAHYFLADYPGEVVELFAAMQRRLVQRAHLLAEHHPADMVYNIENTSTTLISVQQYRELDWPHLKELADIFAAAGRRFILHMCGHLKALLDDLEKLPVTGFEAFTAPPLGNATLADGRAHCPSKCLIGGTHAMLWLEPVEQIIAYIQQRLEELPHHRGIVVTSSGVMPPACPPDKIRVVAEAVRSMTPRWEQ